MILKGNVFSKTLEMVTGITVLTPNDYGSGKPYQVAYLLHGLCGNNTDFVDHTMLSVYADQYHCIFIMPEVGRSFYSDMVYGQNFFSYVSKELPVICKNVFNISAKREDTFVMGVSMGGYGALKSALTYPERYGMCCTFSSGCLFLKDFLGSLNQYGDTQEFTETWGKQFITDFKAAFGENFEWKPEIELLELAKQIKEMDAAPKFYLTCGKEDGMIDLNRQFSDEMKKLDFDVTYEEWNGNHDWYFFNESLKKALSFCCDRK